MPLGEGSEFGSQWVVAWLLRLPGDEDGTLGHCSLLLLVCERTGLAAASLCLTEPDMYSQQCPMAGVAPMWRGRLDLCDAGTITAWSVRCDLGPSTRAAAAPEQIGRSGE